MSEKAKAKQIQVEVSGASTAGTLQELIEDRKIYRPANISVTPGEYEVVIESSTGTAGTLPAATITTAGAMSKDDKAKVNDLPDAAGLAVSLSNKVDKVTGSKLITDDQATKLDELPDNAALSVTLGNKVDKVTGSKLITNDQATKLDALPDNTALGAALDNKVDKAPGYTLVSDSDAVKLSGLPDNAALNSALSGKVSSVAGSGLMTDAQSDKLDELPDNTALSVTLGNKVDKELGHSLVVDGDALKLAGLPTASQLIDALDSKVDSETGKGLIYPAPVTGKLYGQKDGVWAEVPAGGGGTGDVEEAPVDGKQYARKDAAWAEVAAGGGAVDPTKIINVLHFDTATPNDLAITNFPVVTNSYEGYVSLDLTGKELYSASLEFVGSVVDITSPNSLEFFSSVCWYTHDYYPAGGGSGPGSADPYILQTFYKSLGPAAAFKFERKVANLEDATPYYGEWTSTSYEVGAVLGVIGMPLPANPNDDITYARKGVTWVPMVTVISVPTDYTVGVGKDFTTLKEATEFMETCRPAAGLNSDDINVVLAAGYTQTTPLEYYTDHSFYSLRKEFNASCPVSAGAVTSSGAFLAVLGGRTPVIKTNFDLSLVTGSYPILVGNGGTLLTDSSGAFAAGFHNVAGDVYVQSGNVKLSGTLTFTGTGQLQAIDSDVFIDGGSITSTGTAPVLSLSGCRATFFTPATMSNSDSSPLLSQKGGHTSFLYGQSLNGVVLSEGAILSGDWTGTRPFAINTPTAAGLLLATTP